MRRRPGLRVALATLLLVVLLVNKWGVLAPDIKPEIYLAPWQEFSALSRAWRESPKLGEANFNVGLFWVPGLAGLLQAVGLDANLSMRLLRWLLLLLGAWGMVRLYRLVAGAEARRAGEVAAAALFVANPYMIVAGDFLAVVLPAAMLPWLGLFLLRACGEGGWRWPAAAALAFAGMSGMNAGVIPLIQMLCLPALLWYAHAGLGATWRRVGAAFTRWALLALLLSAYWLVPSVIALGAGSHVTAFSETQQGIAGPSSFGEVVRGLGLWTLYGRDADGPWQPGFAAYLTNPFVVAASYAMALVVVAGCALIRGVSRRLVLLLVIPAVVLMVGVHPPASPTPFGHVLWWAIDNVPGVSAFRTTNKVGAVLVLGMALVGALAVGRRWAGTRGRGQILAGSVVVGVLATWPAWTGGIYSLPLPVPDYWQRATTALDQGSPEQRVWFVPGDAQPQYTWSEDRPDDLNNALLSRPSFVRLTLPESAPWGASLLAAVDTSLQEGTLPAGALSSAARYLGVGDVLVRNDVRWDLGSGARPSTVDRQVQVDPGLTPGSTYGSPGENVLRTDAQPASELATPPLQTYRVSDARGTVRTESQSGSVLVDGDGWALAPLVAAGLLPSEPAYTLAGDITAKTLPDHLGTDHRIVLTDTNRRREVTANRLTGAYGPLLGAEEPLGSSITMFDPEQQTTLRVEGGTVTATQRRGVFTLVSNGVPENAFDGDPATGWVFGDFGRAYGQSITLHRDRAFALDHVRIAIPQGWGQRIAQVRISAAGRSQDVAVPADGNVEVRMPGVRATDLTVTVTGVSGSGDNWVSISEIEIPGVQVTRVARLPQATSALADELDATGRDELAATPLDVVLSRVRGTAADPTDDEESRLERDFRIPDARDFRVSGQVRPDAGASDAVLDRLAGLSDTVEVQASSRAHSDPGNRGSQAFDGDSATGWTPAGGAGEWLAVTFPERRLDRVVIEQPTDAAAWVTSADIEIDGRVVATADLRPGHVVVGVPAERASQLRIVVRATTGFGAPTISEVDASGVRVQADPDADPDRCVAIATMDGEDLGVRIGDAAADGTRPVTGCDTLRLDPGDHELRSLSGWVADSLVLRDVQGQDVVEGGPGPDLTVHRTSASEYHATAPAASDPYFLVVGQNVNPGWTVQMDGADLGAPTPIDGYAMGWRIDDLSAHDFTIRFAPQGPADIALGVSGVALLATAAVALAPRRRIHPDPVEDAAGPPDVARATGPELDDLAADDAAAGPGGAAAPPRRRRRLLSWLVIVLGALFLAGPVGLAVAAALAVWHATRTPRPRTLLRAAVVVMGLAPVAWIVGNLDAWGLVGPDLVLQNAAPSALVIASLILLLVGSWREDAE